MSELNPLLSFYLVLNLVMIAIWVLHRLMDTVTQKLGWQLNYTQQLQLLRYVFTAIFLVPLLYFVLANLLPVKVSENLQRPAQIVTVALNDLVGNATESSAPETSTQLEFDAINVLTVALAAFLMALFARSVFRIVRLHRIIRNSYCWKKAGNLQVLISDEISIPFSTKVFFKSQIVIPESLVDSNRFLSTVIAHECHHLRNGDTAWELWFEVISLIFFWNPAIYLWRMDFSKLQEFACDENVLKKKKISRYDYGNCLLQVVALASKYQFKPVASSCMAGSSRLIGQSKSQLERRMLMIMENSKSCISKVKSNCFRAIYISFVATFGIFVVSFMNISVAQPNGDAANGMVKILESKYKKVVVEPTPNEDFQLAGGDLDENKIVLRVSPSLADAATVHYVDELVRAIPDGVFVSSAERMDNSYIVKGFAESQSNVASLMRNLDKSEWYKQVQLNYSRRMEKLQYKFEFQIEVEADKPTVKD